MPSALNPEVQVFLGLNNALDPCSHEYKEGMAYVSNNSRIDESGRWAEQAELTDLGADAPALATNPATDGGSDEVHVKNLAIDGTDYIVPQLTASDVAEVGPPWVKTSNGGRVSGGAR